MPEHNEPNDKTARQPDANARLKAKIGSYAELDVSAPMGNGPHRGAFWLAVITVVGLVALKVVKADGYTIACFVLIMASLIWFSFRKQTNVSCSKKDRGKDPPEPGP